MSRLPSAIVFALAPLTVQASSESAWIEHYRHVTHSCLEASGLRDARADSDLMLFADDIGTALLVRGRDAKSGAERVVLCIARRGPDAVEVRSPDDGVKVDPEDWAKRRDEPCC